jgi:large subunit ribosomal protein L24e
MKCSFCGDTVPVARGKIFVKTTGQVMNFCDSKCHRNWKLGRQGKFLKWTKKFEK